jgi:hypothetical protein
MIRKRVLNTTADATYFSRVLNLIGSVRRHSESPPAIRVWDLGLTPLQKSILSTLDVQLASIPKFSSWWNLCYSWKPYVYQHCPDELFLHLDAGNTVLSDLNDIFDTIELEHHFLVDQGQTLQAICPPDFVEKFNNSIDLSDAVFAAGNIGLDKGQPDISKAISEIYNAAMAGYCLGFSKSEAFRDIYNLNIIRDCEKFRHDQTVANLIIRKYFPSARLHDHKYFAAIENGQGVKIYNQRGYNYTYLRYIHPSPIFVPILLYSLAFDIVSRIRRKIARIKHK